MALADHDDFPISISVEGPYEDDPYGFSQPVSTNDNHFLNDTVGQFEVGLLSPSYPLTPLSEDSSPSSPESLYSLSPSIVDSPLYSPGPLSDVASPFSTASDDLGDFPHLTVSPRDITSSTIDSSFWGPPAADEGPDGYIGLLFEESLEDTPSQDLVAIDGLDLLVPASSTLFSPQKSTDLRISIPVQVCPSRPSTPISYCSESPNTRLPVPSPHGEERSLSPAVSDDTSSQYLDSPSPPSRSLSLVSSYKTQRRPRRSSASSESSLRVQSSPNRSSPRQHPYVRPMVDPGYVAAAKAASMTLEEYMLIVESLQGEDAFKGRDWRNGLPDLIKPVVGSAQTRKASEERRTDNATFCCPVQGCGSTVTKKHNLVYHLRSHYDPEPAYRCPICQKGIGHSASLKRHQKTHGPEAETQAAPHAHGNKKKRGRRN